VEILIFDNGYKTRRPLRDETTKQDSIFNIDSLFYDIEFFKQKRKQSYLQARILNHFIANSKFIDKHCTKNWIYQYRKHRVNLRSIIPHLLIFTNKMCSQQTCSKLVNKLQKFYYFINLPQTCHSQLVDKLLNYSTITSCWNNL
jgi:hypothetical protein